jgi:hypothetical protein
MADTPSIRSDVEDVVRKQIERVKKAQENAATAGLINEVDVLCKALNALTMTPYPPSPDVGPVTAGE